MQQTTNTIVMIRPVNFRMNEQTAVNNYFQEDLELKNIEINAKAQQELAEEQKAKLKQLKRLQENAVDTAKASVQKEEVLKNVYVGN